MARFSFPVSFYHVSTTPRLVWIIFSVPQKKRGGKGIFLRLLIWVKAK
jgi:hypothetical protein